MKTNLQTVTDLRINADVYTQQSGCVVWPAFLSLGGFTEEAKAFCETHGIALAERMVYIEPDQDV
jgi:hypothetical protein